MSLADDAKLLLIPTGYKTSKVYSVFPTDGDGDFTYTRSGDASRVNPGGLIETVGTNIPRIDHFGGGCPTLNLEPQRTNLQVYSEDFNNSAWAKSNSTIDSNSIIAPTGEMTADKVIANTATGNHYVQDVASGLSTSSKATLSVFVKKDEVTQIELLAAQNGSPYTNWCRLRFDLNTLSTFQTPIGDYKYEDFGNGWLRLSITGTPTSSWENIRFTLYKNNTSNWTGNNVDGFYLFGAQVEQGSYPTSYIKTEASTVTRLKDDLQDLNNVDLINSVEGVFYAEIRAFKSETVFRFITLNDGTSSNTVRIYLYNRIYARLLVGGVEQCIFNTTHYDVTEFNKIAFLYSPNNFKLFVNGVLIGTDTSGSTFTNGTLTTLSFDRGDNAFRFDGAVKDLRVYDTALTDAELIELTTL